MMFVSLEESVINKYFCINNLRALSFPNNGLMYDMSVSECRRGNLRCLSSPG